MIGELTPDRPSFHESFVILVGKAPLQKHFTLHNDLFLPRSEFFRAARSAAWREDSQEPTTLDDDDDDPEVFSNYLRCVYLGDMAPLSDDDISKDEAAVEHFNSLAKLWVLADKLGDLQAANLVVDEFISYSDETRLIPPAHTMTMVYESTVGKSPLRALLRDLSIYDGDKSIFEAVPSEPLSGFYQDVARELMTIKERLWSREVTVAVAFGGDHFKKVGRCFYHQHDKHHPEMACVSKRTPSQSTPVGLGHIT